MDPNASVQELFKRWRNDGDADAGMAMAQKFSDWYYAVTSARLGDRLGRQPLEKACAAFEQGIVQVTRTSELVDWAWTLVESACAGVGRRVNGGDFPNALTGNRSPTALIQTAAGRLPADRVRLLRASFDASTSLDELGRLAEEQGGMPLAILQARHELKLQLHQQCQVPFQVLPERPNLDLAPLPLYEAARMASHDEEGAFEKWLISDIELCKDVAEFSAFAHALRAGALQRLPEPKPAQPPRETTDRRAASPPSPSSPPPSAPKLPEPAAEAPPKPTSSRLPIILGLVFVVVFLLVLVVALVLMR